MVRLRKLKKKKKIAVGFVILALGNPTQEYEIGRPELHSETLFQDGRGGGGKWREMDYYFHVSRSMYHFKKQKLK